MGTQQRDSERLTKEFNEGRSFERPRKRRDVALSLRKNKLNSELYQEVGDDVWFELQHYIFFKICGVSV